jgi:uncharacterized protein (UPF0276 family)
MIKLALNISSAAELLLRERRIDLDLFKCPAWPDLVKRVSAEWPSYVHFPLGVGMGWGDAIDTETHGKVDWARMESLFTGTQTRHVNVHLAIKTADCPEISPDANDPALADRVAERMIKDLTSVVKRFGPEKVIAESIYGHSGSYLPQSYLPEVVTRVVEETGCGFLFDLSHARLAARCLGMAPEDYIAKLPMKRVRELHVTGIQMFNGAYVERLRHAGIQEDKISGFEGHFLDHLPMTEEDWPHLVWALEQIRLGNWAKPWVVTFEYGGISSWWAAITDPDVIESQVARMLKMVRETVSRSQSD